MNNYGGGCVNSILGAYSSNCIVPANICKFHYYRDILATKIISLFKFTLPNEWPEFVPWWLVLCGWCAVVRTDDYGVIPIQGTLSGSGIWEQPTEVLISKPLVHFPSPLRIGEKVETLRMSPFYTGAAPIINHYAELLTLADNAITANLINSRIGHVFVAPNASTAKSAETIFDRIALGKPAVIDAKAAENIDGEKFAMLGEPGKHVITDKLLENRRAIYRDFCRDVGIRSGNEDKRERLTTSEVEVSDVETERMLSYWLRHITSSIERVNALFNLNLGVEIDGHDIGSDNADAANPIA